MVAATVMYNLYQDAQAPTRSYLRRDFVADFFADVAVLEAGVAVPVPALQHKLQKILASSAYAAMHNPAYSAVSNPFDPAFQNCNEFVLDVINAALYDTTKTAQLKANAAAYFDAQTIEVNPLRLLVGALFEPDIRMADHHGEPLATATFGSLVAYLRKFDLLAEHFVVTP